jgi:hypothetical protein
LGNGGVYTGTATTGSQENNGKLGNNNPQSTQQTHLSAAFHSLSPAAAMTGGRSPTREQYS